MSDPLLDGYDPAPGLVARGVMSQDHDPGSCDAACCNDGYEPSGMDEFAIPPGWNQVEETVDEYWAAMAKRDPDGPQP